MNRIGFISFWAGTACILLGFAVTGYQTLLGGLIGYWTGFGYTTWVYHDTLMSSELEISAAISRMRRGLFSRLGVVTLIVAAVGRFQRNWLLGLALGIAVGLIVSFITVAIQRIQGERGEEKNG
jgi:membrane protein YqaA with SNARE-associated domain